MTPMTAPTRPVAEPPVVFPGRGISTVIAIWLLAMPLFLIGVILCAGQNIGDYLDGLSRDVVFRVLLKPDVRPADATRLSEEWLKNGNWRSIRVAPAIENLSKIEELSKWVSDAKNRDLLDQLPPSIELRPRNILSSSVNPVRLSAELRSVAEVEQVFYDSEGVVWMREVSQNWRSIEICLLLAFSIIALLGAVGAGWISHKLNATSELLTHEIPNGGKLKFILACSSGLIALIALGILVALFQLSTGIFISFPGLIPSAILLAAGVALGMLSAGSRLWMKSRLARIVLPIVIVFALATTVGARSASQRVKSSRSSYSSSTTKDRKSVGRKSTESKSRMGTMNLDSVGSRLPSPIEVTPDAPALPPQKEALDAGLSAATPEERDRLLQKYSDEIKNREQSINYLDQWLERSDENRQLDQQNTQSSQMKSEMTKLALEYSRKALLEHQDSARRFCVALADSQSSTLGDPIGADDHSRRSLVSWLLINAANQSLFLLDVDRQELDKNEGAAQQSEAEQARLDFFSKYAGLGTNDIQNERRRLEADRVNLIQKRTLLQAAPLAPAPVTAPAPPLQTIVQTEGTPIVDMNEKRPGIPLSQFHQYEMGHYVPLAPGTLIHAIRGGKVLYAGKFIGLGQTVTIEHEGGISSLYAFLSEIVVKRGQEVKSGDYLGTAGIVKPQGTSGIRFELRKSGRLTELESISGLNASNLASRIQGVVK